MDAKLKSECNKDEESFLANLNFNLPNFLLFEPSSQSTQTSTNTCSKQLNLALPSISSLSNSNLNNTNINSNSNKTNDQINILLNDIANNNTNNKTKSLNNNLDFLKSEFKLDILNSASGISLNSNLNSNLNLLHSATNDEIASTNTKLVDSLLFDLNKDLLASTTTTTITKTNLTNSESAQNELKSSTSNDLKLKGADVLHELNLNARIKYLEEELANAQADKEFVWSLWRKLQSTNPDLTSAISSVIQREKEKTDAKDKKVLEVLNEKDKSIQELNKIVLSRQQELSELNEKNKKLEVQIAKKDDELNYMKLNSKTYEDKHQMYEQMLRSRDDKYERAQHDAQAERQKFKTKINDLLSELSSSEQFITKLQQECEQQKNTIDILNTEIKQANENYEKLMCELNKFHLSIDKQIKSDNEKLKQELSTRNDQNDKLRKELDDLWSKFNSNVDYIEQQDKLIKQLKSIKNDLRNTIKSQHETFEKENQSLKNMYEELNRKYEQDIKIKNNLLSEACQMKQKEQEFTMKQIKLNEKSSQDLIKAKQYEIEQLRIQLSIEQEKTSDKELMCEELSRKLKEFETKLSGKFKKLTSKPANNVVETKRSSRNTATISIKRSSSLSSRSKTIQPKANSTKQMKSMRWRQDKSILSDDESIMATSNSFNSNKIKDYYENLCLAKDRQIEMLKYAHARRLEHLNSLEKECTLLKEHLKSYEQSDETVCKELFMKSNQNDEKRNGYVRKDADLISTELKLSQNENKKLLSENFSLKERVDFLQVKCEEQNGQLEALRFELDTKLNDRRSEYLVENEHLEREIKSTKEKLKCTCQELVETQNKFEDLNSKFTELMNERTKYFDLCTRLSQENKKLFKKHFQTKKSDNKYRMLLIDQMKKHSEAKLKRKICKSTNIGNQTNKKTLKKPQGEFLLKLLATHTSSSGSLDQNSESLKNPSQQTGKLRKFKHDKQVTHLKRELERVGEEKEQCEIKLLKLSNENEKLSKELELVEQKLKALRVQNENQTNEIINLKKRDSEQKLREEGLRKQEEQQKEELKKTYEIKLKQSSADLNKQISLNRTLKQENEKLADKLKVNEEKLNHTERDSNQKRQLIEFYKKKLDESSSKEMKLEEKIIETTQSPDVKIQLKRATELNERLKAEVKMVKQRMQVLEGEQKLSETKCAQMEKSFCEANESNKREKQRLESNWKQAKQKIQDLESYIDKLEATAEKNLKDLSNTSQQTLAMAQFRLKYAFNTVDKYESVIRNLYENIIRRSLDLKKALRAFTAKKQKEKNKSEMNDTMKEAMNLASSVLSMTFDELDDIMSSLSPRSTTNDECSNDVNNKIDLNSERSDDMAQKKLLKNLLIELEQCLNASKRDMKSVNEKLSRVQNENDEDDERDDSEKNICQLISNRLNELIEFERQFALLNTTPTTTSH
jgi:centlein